MHIATRSVVQSGFLFVGFLALLGIVGMTFWLGERAQSYFNEAIEARDTRGYAVQLRYAVQAAESSQRGFLLTGNEIYLAPYDSAKTLAERELDALKRMLASAPQSEALVERLSTILSEKFEEMDRTIALKRERRETEAMAIMQTNRGKTLMDEANIFFFGIIRTADERLTLGVAEQRENAVLLRTFSVIGGVIIVLMVGAAAYSLMRYTGELRAARDEVAKLNTELEQRVKDRTADLAEANEEIKRFAFIVTHDLRSPLISIMGFTSELEHSVKSLQALIDRPTAANDPADPVTRDARVAATEDLPEAIGFIRSSTRKMEGLINAILKLSREGQRTLQLERIDLDEVIRAGAAAIQHQVEEAKGEVRVDVDVPPLMNDRLAIEQIVGNLLDNAVKYRARDRPLHIEVFARSEPGDRLSLEVADNGRGIAGEDLERIFDLFGRSGVQDQPGEGIGLAYVRTLVRNLGGEVTVRSKLGEGTTFRVLIPRDLQPARSLAA